MNFLTGQKLVKQKQFGKALSFFLNLEKNENQDNRIYFYLGMIYFELNNFDKSIFYYNKFLKKEPDSISTLYNLATVKQIIGEVDSAKNIYLKLISLDKNKIRPYYGLFTLNENYLTNKNFEDISNIKNKQKISVYEEGIINFILSKKEKKNKKYKKEIEYLKRFHSHIFNSNYEYNMSSQFYYNKIIYQNYNKIKILESNFKKVNIEPIFIIGLPRSGSTLVESILTSGSEKIISYGECHVINMSVLEQIGPKIYIKNFDIKNFKFEINIINLLESITKRYSKFYFENKKKNQIFIDKSLENFFNIEIILHIFPKAKFIHTFRNPTDSIISIYQSMLPELSWTHTIENILIYIDIYFKVLEYFKSKYPEKIIDINLEDLTENSEVTTKKIYKFCNLDWTKDVLNFYKRDDLHSKTLSFNQIKKKISKYDNLKYQPYFHLLDNYKERFRWININ
jgi:tetratricopeptide (TPR) repeat protein